MCGTIFMYVVYVVGHLGDWLIENLINITKMYSLPKEERANGFCTKYK